MKAVITVSSSIKQRERLKKHELQTGELPDFEDGFMKLEPVDFKAEQVSTFWKVRDKLTMPILQTTANSIEWMLRRNITSKFYNLEIEALLVI